MNDKSSLIASSVSDTFSVMSSLMHLDAYVNSDSDEQEHASLTKDCGGEKQEGVASPKISNNDDEDEFETASSDIDGIAKSKVVKKKKVVVKKKTKNSNGTLKADSHVAPRKKKKVTDY